MGYLKPVSQILTPVQDRRYALASLIELDDNGFPLVPGEHLAFQYYPETLEDGRGVEYITKTPVGGSHPLYQWVHSGARTISFQATFTSEVAPPSTRIETLLNAAGAVGLNAREQLTKARQLTGNPIGASISALKGGTDPGKRYTVDVAAALVWLRSKTYPRYTPGGPLSALFGLLSDTAAGQQIAAATSIASQIPFFGNGLVAKPPPKLVLYLPNSGIVSGVNGFVVDAIPCIMLSCDITYESMFRAGHPRIATVSLQFAEVVQVGSNWSYVDRAKLENFYRGRYTVKDPNLAWQSFPGRLTSALSRTAGTVSGFIP